MTTSRSLASPSRRRWLARSLGGCAAAFGTASLGNLLLGMRPAHASDYKALVCVYLQGGNDGMNMLVPTDVTTHDRYAAVRGGLALPRASLVPLDRTPFGLHPALAALAPLWDAGQMAPVFNVGPLAQPMTKADFLARPQVLEEPLALYSHSAQQLLWEAGGTDVLTRTGWGGRAGEVLGTVHPVISISGSCRYGLASLQSALVLPGPGGNFGAVGMDAASLQSLPMAARHSALAGLYSVDEVAALDNRLVDALAMQQRDAMDKSSRLQALVRAQPLDGAWAAMDAAFAPLTLNGRVTTSLGQQLYQVAKLVAGNATVQGNRQIFYVQLHGFDTHSAQVSDRSATDGVHATLLKELADALAAFQSAMNHIGLGPNVTTFTQSDFGRTFAPNASGGTDHGWGNHHLVMGGAVRGGRSYGTYPLLELGGEHDANRSNDDRQGRWIPGTSVDQYAATLLRWFGADDDQLFQILPNLSRFSGATNLGFV